MAKKPEYITREEAAKLLKVTTRTIDRYADMQLLVRYKRLVGRNRVLFKREEVMRLRDNPPAVEK